MINRLIYKVLCLSFLLCSLFVFPSISFAGPVYTDNIFEETTDSGINMNHNVKFKSGPWVDASTYLSFYSAIDNNLNNTITLLISNQQTCNQTITVPQNITLLFLRNGSLSIQNGITITINGPIVAPEGQKIFYLYGTGKADLINNIIQGPAHLGWWGWNPDSSASTNNQAISTAMQSSNSLVCNIAGDYDISDPITFIDRDFQEITFGQNVNVKYSNNGDYAVKFLGVSHCRITSKGQIESTNDAGNGILFSPYNNSNCFYNKIDVNSIYGAGRSVMHEHSGSTARHASSTKNTNIGIKFASIDNSTTQKATMYNIVKAKRISNFSTLAKFELDPNSGEYYYPANANIVDVDFIENYWTGFHFQALEDIVRVGFVAGNGLMSNYAVPNPSSDETGNTYLFKFTDNASSNNAICDGGEPGSNERVFYPICSSCISNKIDIHLSGFAGASYLDLDQGNYNQFKGTNFENGMFTLNIKINTGSVYVLPRRASGFGTVSCYDSNDDSVESMYFTVRKDGMPKIVKGTEHTTDIGEYPGWLSIIWNSASSPYYNARIYPNFPAGQPCQLIFYYNQIPN
ncbi:MAG: hypothetical protein PHE84_14675 [bacterium]|nr:hypothetical protein [bacterium]